MIFKILIKIIFRPIVNFYKYLFTTDDIEELFSKYPEPKNTRKIKK